MTQKPSVGRIVHIGVQPRAAIIVGVGQTDRVNLVVWQADGWQSAKQNVPYSETPSDDAWSWPPRA